MGNVIVFKKGKNRPVKKVMLCAHMDEVGFVITNITEREDERKERENHKAS